MRLFGVSQEGHSIVAHIHGYDPYFYVQVSPRGAVWFCYASAPPARRRSGGRGGAAAGRGGGGARGAGLTARGARAGTQRDDAEHVRGVRGGAEQAGGGAGRRPEEDQGRAVHPVRGDVPQADDLELHVRGGASLSDAVCPISTG